MVKIKISLRPKLRIKKLVQYFNNFQSFLLGVFFYICLYTRMTDNTICFLLSSFSPMTTLENLY